jgi:cytoskeletal protein CcmA (bactofilin family)
MPAGARADLTVIAVAGRVTGEVAGSGDVRVDGTVDGAIHCGGQVLISEGGRVTASVRGQSVTVAGTVEGNINADERIQLDPTARVVGDLVAPRILIQDGASLQGAVEMTAPPKRGTRPAALSAAQPAAEDDLSPPTPVAASDDKAQPDEASADDAPESAEEPERPAPGRSARSMKRRSRRS